MANHPGKLNLVNKSARIASLAVLGAALSFASPAFAANRDIVQLQTQVQQLQDSVARLQQSTAENMGVMKDLIQQSADTVNKMSANMDDLKKQLLVQQNKENNKVDQVSSQIQSMNDSIDEVKARIASLEKVLQNIQNQQQSMSATMQPATPGLPDASAATPGGAPSDASAMPAPATGPGGKPLAGTPMPLADAGPAAPPADQLYKTALGDYMSAKYSLAASEFSDVTKYYPDNPLSGNAYYYQGEIAYRGGHYSDAIKNYDKVIEQYPASNKVPVSRLHKGNALVASKQTTAGVRELRSLIQRFPNSPEAMQARSKLSGMGVPVNPRR